MARILSPTLENLHAAIEELGGEVDDLLKRVKKIEKALEGQGMLRP